jgi:hypothetical protein
VIGGGVQGGRQPPYSFIGLDERNYGRLQRRLGPGLLSWFWC